MVYNDVMMMSYDRGSHYRSFHLITIQPPQHTYMKVYLFIWFCGLLLDHRSATAATTATAATATSFMAANDTDVDVTAEMNRLMSDDVILEGRQRYKRARRRNSLTKKRKTQRKRAPPNQPKPATRGKSVIGQKPRPFAND